MTRIEGAVYDSSGNVTAGKDAHIEYEITESSFSNNTHTVNAKCYLDVTALPSVPAIIGKTLTLQHTGGTPVESAIPQNSTSITVGNSYLLGETNFTIAHGKDGSAKVVTLSATATLFPGGSLDHIAVSGDITLPKLSNGHKNIGGTWKQCFIWLKIADIFKRCIIWRNIDGVWKKGK